MDWVQEKKNKQIFELSSLLGFKFEREIFSYFFALFFQDFMMDHDESCATRMIAVCSLCWCLWFLLSLMSTSNKVIVDGWPSDAHCFYFFAAVSTCRSISTRESKRGAKLEVKKVRKLYFSLLWISFFFHFFSVRFKYLLQKTAKITKKKIACNVSVVFCFETLVPFYWSFM